MSKVLRVGLVAESEVIEQGLQAILRPYAIEVIPFGRARAVEMVDLVLVDAYVGGQVSDLLMLVDLTDRWRVVIYTWSFAREDLRSALRAGVRGWLSKSLDGEVIAAGLQQVQEGETVVNLGARCRRDEPGPGPTESGIGPAEPVPESAEGLVLSPREKQVLALILEGLTNQDIAAELFVSPNSIKSYIRSAYRKIGVQRRSQAVVWGMQNGLAATN